MMKNNNNKKRYVFLKGLVACQQLNENGGCRNQMNVCELCVIDVLMYFIVNWNEFSKLISCNYMLV
jgi:hypothetical protein